MSLLPFPFNVFLAAFVSGFATTFATLPLWRRWCLRTGLVDDPGHRKIHSTPIALAGGLAVLTGLLVPLAFAALALKFGWAEVSQSSALDYGLHKRFRELAGIAVGAVGMTLLGWLDDK